MADLVDSTIRASDLARAAWEAARQCDRARALRLRARAERALKAARKAIKAFKVDPRSVQSTESQNQDLISANESVSQTDTVLRLAKTQLEFCDSEKQIYKFVPECGTFENTKDCLSGSKGRHGIRFEFRLFGAADKPKCKKLCLVSVFHYEEEDTGRKPKKLSMGGSGPQDTKLGAKELFLGGRPRQEDAVDGYVVDKSPEPSLAQMKGSKVPCFPTQKSLDPKELPLKKGPFRARKIAAGVTAVDFPSDLRKGYVQHFETAAVCLDPKPIKILASMRWRLRLERDGDLKAEILKLKKRVDRGAASLPFQKALRKWLKNNG